MGKVKQINTKKAPEQKKKITKTNSFGQYASNKTQIKDKKYANKEIITASLIADKKKNQFQDSKLSEKRRQLQGEKPQSRLSSILMKGTQKKKRFDLDSDGENDDAPLKLTHKGKAIEDFDDFKDKMDFSSGDENVPAELVDKLNFTGFEQPQAVDPSDPLKKKSKKEVYEEIIKKSKKMKYERQQQKEEDKGKLRELNDGYDDIVELLKFRRTYKAENNEEADEFDKLTRELQSEVKTQANTVMKKVEDKKEKKLQEKRRKQLKGIMSSDGEEEKDLNNDDELQSNTKRELGIIKHMRKVENLNKFIDQIKTVKNQTKKAKKGDDDESEDEYDSLDEIDLDEQEGDSSDEGSDDEDEMEHLELEDEFESDDEKQPNKSNNKAAKSNNKKAQESDEEDDDEIDEEEGDEEEDGDEDEEIDSDEFNNESD